MTMTTLMLMTITNMTMIAVTTITSMTMIAVTLITTTTITITPITWKMMGLLRFLSRLTSLLRSGSFSIS
jgi:hypothetical protein